MKKLIAGLLLSIALPAFAAFDVAQLMNDLAKHKGGTGQHGQQPEQEAAASAQFHLVSSASMVISERSPSAC